MSTINFNISEYIDKIDLLNIRKKIVSFIKICNTNYLSISTNHQVFIILYDDSDINSSQSSDPVDYDVILLDFSDTNSEITCLLWISSGNLLIGFDNGNIMSFNEDGNCVFEYNFNESKVNTFRMNEEKNRTNIWVLYEGGFIVMIPFDIDSKVVVDNIIKFKLLDQANTDDFCLSKSVHMTSPFMATDEVITVLVVGANCFLSIYNIGGPQYFQNLNKLTSYVKEKVSGLLTRTIRSVVNVVIPGKDTAPEDSIIHISASLDIDDTKRRALRISMDPSGRFAALADNLGRVLLYDVISQVIIRIWKGLREAQLSWSTNTINNQLRLVIYAPQLSLLYLHEIRHGDCLYSLPVGPNCVVFSSITNNVSDCYLLRVNKNLLHMILINESTINSQESDENNVMSSTDANDIIDVNTTSSNNIYDNDTEITTEKLLSQMEKVLLSYKDIKKPVIIDYEKRIMNHMSTIDDKYKYQSYLDLITNINKLEYGFIWLDNIIDVNLNTIDNKISSKMKSLSFSGFSNEFHNSIIDYLLSNPMSYINDNNNNKLIVIRKEILDSYSILMNIYLSITEISNDNNYDVMINNIDINNNYTISIDLYIILSIKYFKYVNSFKNKAFRNPMTFTWFNEITTFSTSNSSKYLSKLLSIDLSNNIDMIDIILHMIESSNYKDIALNLIELVINPIIYDSFAMKPFNKVIQLFHWNQKQVYINVLSMLFIELSNSSYHKILDILNIDKSISPFDRWLKDLLLSLHDHYMLYTSFLENPDDNVVDSNEFNWIMEYNTKFQQSNENEQITFDDIISYLSDSIINLCEKSSNNLAILSFISTINKSFITINEQITRRTFNLTNLNKTIDRFQRLYKQCRICLLLSIRLNILKGKTVNISIDNVNKGDISIYEALAYDSLHYTNVSVDCDKHELRCKSLNNNESVDCVVNKSLDHKIWKEILSTIENDYRFLLDRNSNNRRSRPLLVYFPNHNISDYLRCHRSLIWTKKWFNKPHHLEYIDQASNHLSNIDISLLSLISNDMLITYIIPHLISYYNCLDNSNTLANASEKISKFVNILSDQKKSSTFSNIIMKFISMSTNKSNNNSNTNNTTDETWPSLSDKYIDQLLSNQVSSNNHINTVESYAIFIELKPIVNIKISKLSMLLDSLEEIMITNSKRENRLRLMSTNIRENFIKDCFYTVSYKNSYIISKIYQLGHIWQINVNSMHLLHLTSLLDNETCDENVIEKFIEIENKIQGLDIIIQSIRLRINRLIIKFESNNKYSSIIERIDLDILAWISGANRSDVNYDNESFNIKSTRTLLENINKLLLNNVIANIDIERKLKCESLLNVCEIIMKYYI